MATLAPHIDTPVLIVGGGPAGLVAALLLAHRGIACTVVERRTAPSTLPRARGLNARAMEILRVAGLEPDLRAVALDPEPVVRFQERLSSPTLRRVVAGGDSLAEISPCEGASMSQDVFESVLRRRVDATPLITARWGAAVNSIESDDDGTIVQVVDSPTGTTDEIRSRYVIAADGARSGIRDLLGIGMAGPPDFAPQRTVSFRADLTPWVGDRPGTLYFLTAVSAVMLWTHPDNRWSLSFPVTPDGPDAVSAVRDAIGSPDLAVEIIAEGNWSPGTTTAAHYRRGPVFLIGDAAHRVTPMGGTGMNMAIHDAHNLAWKLAMVLLDRAGDGLLESYAAEREPVGARNTTESRQQWQAAFEGGPPGLARGFREVDMGDRYASSAVVDGLADGRDPATEPDDDYRPSAAPGGRAPHLWLGAGRSTIDLFDTRFVLLTGPAGAAWRDDLDDEDGPLSVVIDEPTWPALYGIGAAGAVLVRPDGHVAWRSAELPNAPSDALQQAFAAVTFRSALAPSRSAGARSAEQRFGRHSPEMPSTTKAKTRVPVALPNRSSHTKGVARS